MNSLIQAPAGVMLLEVGEASVLTMGVPGPNMEYGPGGGRPLVHF